MEKTGNCIEMDKIIMEEELKPLDEKIEMDGVRRRNSIEQNSESKNKIKEAITSNDGKGDLEQKFYQIIFSIIIPYVYIGCPLNFCFSRVDKNIHKFATSLGMKVMMEG